jgi:hypothetical protein
VAQLEEQHRVMIEAVENHMPEALVRMQRLFPPANVPVQTFLRAVLATLRVAPG